MTTCTLLRALHDFWAQTGLSCWLEGHTHQTPPSPYLLYTAGRGNFGEMTPVTATAWFSGKDAAKQRAETAQMMEALLPREGSRLPTEGGIVLLDRDQERFMEMVSNDTDPAQLGLKIKATLRVYD